MFFQFCLHILLLGNYQPISHFSNNILKILLNICYRKWRIRQFNFFFPHLGYYFTFLYCFYITFLYFSMYSCFLSLFNQVRSFIIFIIHKYSIHFEYNSIELDLLRHNGVSFFLTAVDENWMNWKCSYWTLDIV